MAICEYQYAPASELYEEQHIEFDKLQQESDALPIGELVGFIMSFPIADGYANYRVVSTKPFEIEHLGFGDCYQIPAAHIRGLCLEDAKLQQRQRKQICKMFPPMKLYRRKG